MVELVVNRTHWEHRSLERTELLYSNLGRWSSFGGVRQKSVLKHEPSLELSLNDGEELRCSQMRVGRVHRAWVQEADGRANALVDKDGEVVLICEDKSPAFPKRSSFSSIIENETRTESVVVEQLLAFAVDSQESIEAANVGDCAECFFGKSNICC